MKTIVYKGIACSIVQLAEDVYRVRFSDNRMIISAGNINKAISNAINMIDKGGF